MRKRDAGRAEQIVLQVERHQRAQPQKADDLPAILGHRLVDGGEVAPLLHRGPDPIARQVAGYQKRRRGADRRGGDDDRHAPEAIGETGQHREQRLRREHDRADDVDQRENRDPAKAEPDDPGPERLKPRRHRQQRPKEHDRGEQRTGAEPEQQPPRARSRRCARP